MIPWGAIAVAAWLASRGANSNGPHASASFPPASLVVIARWLVALFAFIAVTADTADRHGDGTAVVIYFALVVPWLRPTLLLEGVFVPLGMARAAYWWTFIMVPVPVMRETPAGRMFYAARALLRQRTRDPRALELLERAGRLAFGTPVILLSVCPAQDLDLAAIAAGRARFQTPAERWPYVVFFAGVLLTGFGSAYYHLAPDNARLFWDRLPMTVAFMGLVSAQMVERIDVRRGLALLAPLVALGVLSVVYWRATERAGAGNVVPYAVLQATAVFVLLLLAILKPSRYTRGPDLYWVFLAYVLAKVFEALDREIFSLGGLVSGHTLKHLAAGAAAGVVIRMLLRRSVRVGRHG